MLPSAEMKGLMTKANNIIEYAGLENDEEIKEQLKVVADEIDELAKMLHEKGY